MKADLSQSLIPNDYHVVKTAGVFGVDIYDRYASLPLIRCVVIVTLSTCMCVVNRLLHTISCYSRYLHTDMKTCYRVYFTSAHGLWLQEWNNIKGMLLKFANFASDLIE